MPVTRTVQHLGNFTTDEVDLFWRTYDATKGDGETEADKEHRASRIIANYMAGITDEDELTELSRRPLGR
ncbi:MAG: hypothetical protein J0H60_26315 [Rhizobiales bacterium]|nr:hypothetical protein [Hyphomicrobiales bacterium]